MKISVIVCTFNRSYAIANCLDSIADSLAAAAPIEAEIIVVDNGSTDDTAIVIKKWLETCAFSVQALYEPKKGVSAARNCAIRAARGELLVFTDDDCRLHKNYVIDALRHDATDVEPVLRGGRVELGDPNDLPLTIKTSSEPSRWHRNLNSARYENIADSIVGCNMAMRRTVADKIGFFDEHLGAGKAISASEDTDFLFRAYLAGIALVYVPDMTLSHFHGRKSVEDGRKLLRNYAIGNGAMYAKYLFKYPDFCRQLFWDIKSLVNERILRKNKSWPHEHYFSRAEWLKYCALGAFKYCCMAIRNI